MSYIFIIAAEQDVFCSDLNVVHHMADSLEQGLLRSISRGIVCTVTCTLLVRILDNVNET